MCEQSYDKENIMFPAVDKIRTGKRIAFWMRTYDLTPKDIQKYLSLSCVQTIYRWMDGTNIPTIDNLYALSRLFNVDMNAIVVGKDMEGEEITPFLKQMFAYWGLYEARIMKLN